MLLPQYSVALAIASIQGTAASRVALDSTTTKLLFVSTAHNDLLATAQSSSSISTVNFTTLAAALNASSPGDGLLITADALMPSSPGKPQSNTTVRVDWAAIAAKRVRAYVEFPRALDDGATLVTQQTLWERAVVSAADGVGASGELPRLALLHPHKYVDFVRLPETWLAHADLVLAKVAGYDNATFGLPAATSTYPLLARHPDAPDSVLVAATQLSRCRLRRFAPSTRWMAVTRRILEWASGGTWGQSAAVLPAPAGVPAPNSPSSSPPPSPPPPSIPLWAPSVSASFSRSEPLPPSAELQALVRGVGFYRSSLLMPDARRARQLASLVPTRADLASLKRRYARLSPPFGQRVSGDGQLGIFEGLTSDVAIDGTQPQANSVRCDCVSESSSSFAVRAVLTDNASDARVAANLLSFAHLHSGFHQPWALGAGSADRRPWVVAGDAFGVMGWATNDGAYEEFYKDDDARGLLGAMVTAALLRPPPQASSGATEATAATTAATAASGLGTDRWDATIATAVLGNLRATTRSGFGKSSSRFAEMVDAANFSARGGWRKTYDDDAPPPATFSPHYECYIWAVLLLGYAQSGYAPLLERARAGITATMAGYPHRWVPTANGIAMQRARILLPLAFLLRVEDTAQHRAWLLTALDGLRSRRHCEGRWCAYREELSHAGWGGATRVPTNDDYGTFEAPLNQANDDPVSDLLYTTNFALLGLHEAAAALGGRATPDGAAAAADEDALAELVVRLQARSRDARTAALDGAFFRAFDFDRWEAWGSDADVGWGMLSVESGWTQSWLTVTLGLRLLNSSVWELGTSGLRGIEGEYAAWIPVMFPEEGEEREEGHCQAEEAAGGECE